MNENAGEKEKILRSRKRQQEDSVFCRISNGLAMWPDSVDIRAALEWGPTGKKKSLACDG